MLNSLLRPGPFYWVFDPGTNTRNRVFIGYLSPLLSRIFDPGTKCEKLIKLTFSTGLSIRFLNKGGTKSEFFKRKKRQRVPPLDFFSKILFLKKNRQKLVFFKN